MKLDILSRRMMTERQGIRIRTSLCYNNTLKRFTLSVFQLEGLQEYEEGFPHVYVKVILIFVKLKSFHMFFALTF